MILLELWAGVQANSFQAHLLCTEWCNFSHIIFNRITLVILCMTVSLTEFINWKIALCVAHIVLWFFRIDCLVDFLSCFWYDDLSNRNINRYLLGTHKVVSSHDGGFWTHKRWIIKFCNGDLFIIVHGNSLWFLTLYRHRDIFIKRFNSVNPITSTILSRQFLNLLVRLSWYQLELLWPDMSGASEVQHFLASCIYDHWCHLISRVSLIFKWATLTDHFV